MDSVKPKTADKPSPAPAPSGAPASATDAPAAPVAAAAPPAAEAAPAAAEAAAAESPSADMVEVLARLMIVAAVYPPGHPRIATIVDPVLAVVRATATQDHRYALSLGSPKKTESGPATRLRRELENLGVARIEFEREVSVTDLVEFARFLRRLGSSHPLDGTLRHIDFGKLPRTIRIAERSFGLPSFREDEVTLSEAPRETPKLVTPAGTPEAPAQTADPGAVQEDAAALLRRCVRAALDDQRAEVAAAVASAHLPDDGRWSPVAVAEAVLEWAERFRSDEQAVPAPKVLLADAEKELPKLLPGADWSPVLVAMRRVVEDHLRSANGGTAADPDLPPPPPELDPAAAPAAVPLDADVAARHDARRQLLRSVEQFVAGAEPFALMPGIDRAEHLSVLLHLLSESATRSENEVVVRRLGPALSEALGQRESQVLVGWLRDLARIADPQQIDRRLMPVLGALRRSGGGSVPDALTAACADPHADLAVPLWPYLAHELVTGDDLVEQPRRERLAYLVGRVAATRLREESDRLRALVVLGARTIARSVIVPPRPELRGLYEALLATPREAGFAGEVATAFARFPPSHPAAGALAVLDPAEERAHRLLARILREGDEPTAGSRTLAVETIVGVLRALPRRRRTEPWVPEAITSLARLPCEEATEMLQEIRSSRRMVFVRLWPAPARRAALSAMQRQAVAGAARTAKGAA
jgi:hypothetical protein